MRSISHWREMTVPAFTNSSRAKSFSGDRPRRTARSSARWFASVSSAQTMTRGRFVWAATAAAICARFGGGGHKGAAGATLAMTLAEAEQLVTKTMMESV